MTSTTMLTTPYPKPKGILLGLSLAFLFGLAGLGLGVTNRFGLDEQADQRNADRIESDVAGCRRGNEFRQQIINVARASEELDKAILDTAFTPTGPVDPARAAAIEEFRHRFDAPIEKYHAAIAVIHLVDCDAVVPGAKEQP